MCPAAEPTRTDRLPGPSSPDRSERGRWRRLLFACLAFLVYESVLILAFGDYFYTGVSSETGARLMLAAATAGYLALGALSGSFVSVLAVPLPIAIAFAAGGDPPADAWGGEPMVLYVGWAFWSVFFLPAWILGAVSALIRVTGRKK